MLIDFFFEGLKLSVKVELEQRGPELNNGEKIIKRAI